jgi:hypothetical protein
VSDLGQVLTDWRGQASVLRMRGHPREAALIEQLCDEVRAAAVSYLEWLTEDEAMLRSDRSRAYFRSRFPQWESEQLAWLDGRRRRYRACIVPRRPDVEAAKAAARVAAKEAAA